MQRLAANFYRRPSYNILSSIGRQMSFNPPFFEAKMFGHAIGRGGLLARPRPMGGRWARGEISLRSKITVTPRPEKIGPHFRIRNPSIHLLFCVQACLPRQLVSPSASFLRSVVPSLGCVGGDQVRCSSEVFTQTRLHAALVSLASATERRQPYFPLR